jgi:hypothetical protein
MFDKIVHAEDNIALELLFHEVSKIYYEAIKNSAITEQLISDTNVHPEKVAKRLKFNSKHFDEDLKQNTDLNMFVFNKHITEIQNHKPQINALDTDRLKDISYHLSHK